jgi:hypothetical protein
MYSGQTERAEKTSRHNSSTSLSGLVKEVAVLYGRGILTLPISLHRSNLLSARQFASIDSTLSLPRVQRQFMPKKPRSCVKFINMRRTPFYCGSVNLSVDNRWTIECEVGYRNIKRS